MKYEYRLKGFKLISLVLAVLLSFAILTGPVLAASATRTISAAYCGVSLYVEGNLIIPKDAAGNVVEPFLYNGTTYLPVRAVSEAMGKQVKWDGAASSVYIYGSATPTAPSEGSPAPKDVAYQNISVTYSNIKLYVDDVLVTPKDAAGNTVEPFLYNGTTYLPVRAVGNALGKAVGWNDASKTVYLTTTSSQPISSDDDFADDEAYGELGEPDAYLQDLTPTSYGPDRISTRLIKPAVNLYDVEGFRIYRGVAFYNSVATETYEATYDFGGAYNTFAGELSISWDDANSVSSSYTYILTIIADGKEVYTSPKFHYKSHPIKVVAELNGAKEVMFRLTPSVGKLEGSGTGVLIPIALIRTAGLYK